MVEDKLRDHFDYSLGKVEVVIYSVLALLLSVTVLAAIASAGKLLWDQNRSRCQEPFPPKNCASTFRRSASFRPRLMSGLEPPRRNRRGRSSFTGKAIRSFSTTGRGLN